MRGTCESCGGATNKGNARCSRCAPRKPGKPRSDPPGYIRPSVRGACSECGKTVQVTRSSAPPDRRRCRDCQHARPKPRYVPLAWGPQVLPCPTCGVKFTQHRAGQKYCRPECRPSRHVVKANTGERGYDAQHRKWRRRALAALDPGAPCPRCGEPMWPDSQPLDLDHTDDRRGYLGLSHASCNRSAGAKMGNRRGRPFWQRRHRQLELFRASAVKAAKPRKFRGACSLEGCTDERAKQSDRCPRHLHRLFRIPVPAVSKRCVICGSEFMSTAKSLAKTCGDDCRQRNATASRKSECRQEGCPRPATRTGRLCGPHHREVMGNRYGRAA
jgi:hypothetical protein